MLAVALNGRDEDTGDSACKRLNRRAAALRFTQQCHDPREHGLAAHPFRFHQKAAHSIDGVRFFGPLVRRNHRAFSFPRCSGSRGSRAVRKAGRSVRAVRAIVAKRGADFPGPRRPRVDHRPVIVERSLGRRRDWRAKSFASASCNSGSGAAMRESFCLCQRVRVRTVTPGPALSRIWTSTAQHRN